MALTNAERQAKHRAKYRKVARTDESTIAVRFYSRSVDSEKSTQIGYEVVDSATAEVVATFRNRDYTGHVESWRKARDASVKLRDLLNRV